MATTDSTQVRLMAERARALAILLLTRRPDVVVEDVRDDVGLDLVARLTHEHKPGLRQLGVELKSALEPVKAGHANRVLRPTLQSHLSYGPFPFPVVLFFFTMRDDAGWYTWVAEPIVTSDGRVQLPLRSEPDCHPLDAEAMDSILDRVDHWYDAHYVGLSATATEDKRK